MKHFLRDTDFSPAETNEVFSLARAFKKGRRGHTPPSLRGQSWALLFFKNSTRTRVSFEVGIQELGGFPLFLESGSSQIGRGETIADTARTLSRYVHGLVIRCFDQAVLDEFARAGTVPVVNALTDLLHPCQAFTDYFTFAECVAEEDESYVEALKGRKLVFLGDTASNMASSLALSGSLFGVEVVLSGPEGFKPTEDLGQLHIDAGLKPTWRFEPDAQAAVEGAEVVYTDVWVSMGKDAEKAERLAQMKPWQVSDDLMKRASSEAVFMHCLPAHCGEEVTETVFEGSQSIVFDQAENRLHVQKAILAVLAEAAR